MNNFDKKKLMDLAKTLGCNEPSNDQMKELSSLTDNYKNKSEQEIVEELKKLKKTLNINDKKFNRQLEALDGIKELLDEKQRNKLESVLRILKDS